MRRFIMMLALLFGFAALPFAVHAQGQEDTMTPVSEDGELPGDAAEEAHEAAEFGLETARQARELGNDDAEDAADAGKAFGGSTAERAEELPD